MPIFFAVLYYHWTAPGGRHVPQVATVTCPHNGDVAPIHDRMGVLLAPVHIGPWLSGGSAAKSLMRPLADSALAVTEATDVDWERP